MPNFSPTEGYGNSYYNPVEGFDVSNYAPSGGWQQEGFNQQQAWDAYNNSQPSEKVPRAENPSQGQFGRSGYGNLNPYSPTYLQDISRNQSDEQKQQLINAQEGGKQVQWWNPFGGSFLGQGGLHRLLLPAAEVAASFFGGPLASAAVGGAYGAGHKGETNYQTGEKGQPGGLMGGFTGGLQGYGVGSLAQGAAGGIKGLLDSGANAGSGYAANAGNVGSAMGDFGIGTGTEAGSSAASAAGLGGGVLGAGNAINPTSVSQTISENGGPISSVNTYGGQGAVPPLTDVGARGGSQLFPAPMSVAEHGKQLLDSLGPASSAATPSAAPSGSGFGSALLDALFGTQTAEAANQSIPQQQHENQTSREPLNFNPSPSQFQNNPSLGVAPNVMNPQMKEMPVGNRHGLGGQQPSAAPNNFEGPLPPHLSPEGQGHFEGPLPPGRQNEQRFNLIEPWLAPGGGQGQGSGVTPIPLPPQLSPGGQGPMGAFNPGGQSNLGVSPSQISGGQGAGTGPIGAPGAKQGGLGQNPALSGLLGGAAGALGSGPGSGGVSGGTGPGQQGPGQGPGGVMQNFNLPNQQSQQQFQLPQFQPFSFPTSQIGGGSQFLSGDVGGLYGRLRKLLQLQQQNQAIQQGGQATQIGQQAGQQSSAQGGQAGGKQ